MNQSLLLHVIERLESFASKLPTTIQKPILNELTPLKELFLRQRSPRFVFVGSNKIPLPQLVSTIFATAAPDQDPDATTKDSSWSELKLKDRGSVAVLDARRAEKATSLQEKLEQQPADVVLFVDNGESAPGRRKGDIDDLIKCLDSNDRAGGTAKIIVAVIPSAKSGSSRGREHDKNISDDYTARIRSILDSKPTIRDHILDVVTFANSDSTEDAQKLMSILARELPNEARIEMIRISRDSEGQHQVAQVLVKSTTAICTAIGAQPIPLADMPILTTLQLVMVSGIMYISGRERSMRAATEFVGALGANVGIGMLLREGTRAILKFVPGWGNVVCGMVAGAGTYAMGRAAIAFFLEGASIQEARKTYLASRKRPQRPLLLGRKKQKTRSARAK
jgi:uncharacterized protein (DUF697 family)